LNNYCFTIKIAAILNLGCGDFYDLLRMKNDFVIV